MAEDNKPKRAVFSIDANLHNADWPKQSWDLLDIDSIDKLRAYLGAHRISAESFMALPVYQANVERMPWLKELANEPNTVNKSRGGATSEADDAGAALLDGDHALIEEMVKSQRMLNAVNEQITAWQGNSDMPAAEMQRLEESAQELEAAIARTRYRIYGPKEDEA